MIGAAAEIVRETRVALKGLGRRGLFTVAAVSTLAFGVGVTAAMFAFVDAVVMRTVPYPDPDRVVSLGPVSDYEFENVVSVNSAFQAVAATRTINVNARHGEYAQMLNARAVTGGFFDVLGVTPVLGRSFSADEFAVLSRIGNAAIISEGLWRDWFGGDPDVLGQTIAVNGATDPTDLISMGHVVVVGVLSSRFEFPVDPYGARFDLLLPFRVDPDRQPRVLASGLARLRPGVTAAAAQLESDQRAALIRQYYPDFDRRASVSGLRDDVLEADYSKALLFLLAAAGLVYLLSVANVTNLFLSQTLSRTRDVLTHSALGAGRTRILRRFVVEGILIGVVGGLSAVAVATGLIRIGRRFVPPEIPYAEDVHVSWTVLLFCIVLATVGGVMVGLAAGARVLKRSAFETLRVGGAAGWGRVFGRVMPALVTLQLAVALILLVASGLLLKSFVRLTSVDLGFDPSNVIVARMYDIVVPYPLQPDRWRRVYGDAMERVRAMPGVESASFSRRLLVDGAPQRRALRVDGDLIMAESNLVSDGYFRTMGIPILDGRDFERDEDAPVAVVSEALARQAWGEADVVGRTIVVGRTLDTYAVIGVVGDVRARGYDDDVTGMLYSSFVRRPRNGAIVVKTTGDATMLAGSIGDELSDVDDALPRPELETMSGYVRDSVLFARVRTTLIGMFAVLATGVAVLGIYGVTSMILRQRRGEVAIRIAMGATTGDIVWLFGRHGLLWTSVGIGIGLMASYVSVRSLSAFVFGIETTDVPTFVAGAVSLAAAAGAATLVAAFTQSQVSPSDLLRS